MSGQMSNGEIEGVLASIRRLLRDDATDPGPEAGTGPQEVWPGAMPDDVRGAGLARPARKLVLNPDAMVRMDAGMAAPRPAGTGVPPLVLTDPALVPGREGSASAGADLTDDPRVAAWSAPLLLSDPVVLPDEGGRDAGPVAGPVPDAPVPDAPFPDTPVRAADPAQDGAGGDPGPASLHAPESAPEPAPEAARAPEVVWRPAPRAAVPGTPTRRPPSLEERIAELEAALARDEATLEPDGGDPAPGTAPVGVAEGAPSGAQWGDGPVTREGSGLQPRLGPAEVRAWIAAESLKAFGTLPEELADEIADEMADGVAAGTADDLADGIADRIAGALADEVAGAGTAAVADADADALWPGDADPRPVDRAAWADDPGPDTGAIAPDAGQGGAPPGPQVVDAADQPPAAADDLVALAPDTGPEPDASDGMGTGGPPADPAPADPAPADLPVARHADASLLLSEPGTDHGLDPALAAAVRALVSDTIRAELRGPLGEELTRSIRRLVRREWARLSAPND
jgi:hypothetical protein